MKETDSGNRYGKSTDLVKWSGGGGGGVFGPLQVRALRLVSLNESTRHIVHLEQKKKKKKKIDVVIDYS